MKKCIYCQKTDAETTFSTGEGEHLFPQLLGRFNLYFGDDTVCVLCNKEIGRLLENPFKEGSLAGVHSAVYGINDASSVRVTKDRVSWTITSDTGKLGVFNGVFPFMNVSSTTFLPRPIIILDHNESKIKYILFADKYELFAANLDGKEFIERKEHLAKLKERFKNLDISLFGNTSNGWTIERIINLLKKYGLTYNKASEEKFEDAERGTKWYVNYTEKGDAQTLRVPAKIAFNYFTFCALKAGMPTVIHHRNFDYIRRFVRYGELPPQEFKPQFSYDSGTNDKQGLHFVSFQEEGGYIVSLVSLFGRFNYRVVLAKYPLAVDPANFGCATALDPFTGDIITSLYPTPQIIVGKKDYGLFCR